MNASINQLEVRTDLTIRKGSVVTLDLHGDGKPIEVKVDEITMSNGNIFIESYTTGYGCLLTHSADQYRRSGTLIKY